LRGNNEPLRARQDGEVVQGRAPQRDALHKLVVFQRVALEHRVVADRGDNIFINEFHRRHRAAVTFYLGEAFVFKYWPTHVTCFAYNTQKKLCNKNVKTLANLFLLKRTYRQLRLSRTPTKPRSKIHPKILECI